MKRILKKINVRFIGKVCYWVVVLFLAGMAGIVLISALSLPNGIKTFNVMSGSMEPTISTGSLVVIRPQNEYRKGDVITYKSDSDRNNPAPVLTITHRIVSVDEKEGKIRFITRGDANKVDDVRLTEPELILGRVIFHVPLLGYPIAYAKTREGIIFLVVIPATLIIYSELMNIKNEAKRLIVERRTRKLTAVENIEEKAGEEVMATESWFKKLKKRLFGKRIGKRK